MSDVKIPVAPLGADAATVDDFQVYSAPSLVRFLSRGVQPPSYVYLKHTDTLQVNCAASQVPETVTVNYRLLRADGSLVKGQFLINITTAYTTVSQKEPMAEGFLLSMSCKASMAFTRGQTFVRAFLTSGALGAGQPSYMLMADYVTNQMAPAYPNGRVLAPTEGPGFIRPVAIAAPAAGTEFQIPMPANARWRVICGAATFTTSAAVGNRNPGIQLVASGIPRWFGTAFQNVGPSSTMNIAYGHSNNTSNLVATQTFAPLPAYAFLVTAAIIESTTPNLAAADQYSFVEFLVEEWLDNL